MQVIRGADQTTPIDVNAVTTDGVSTTTMTNTGITTVSANALVFSFYGIEDNVTCGSFTSGFTGCSCAGTAAQLRNSTTAGTCTIYKQFVSAGPTGDIVAEQLTNGPDRYAGIVVAIREAAAAGSTLRGFRHFPRGLNRGSN